MSVVGETAGIEKVSVFETDQNYDLNVDTRPDAVTVKVTHPEGLRVGQILYLIETDFDYKGNNQGTIVGQFVVKSIFNTAFFGLNLRGEGYFRLIEDRIMTVAKPVESAKIQEAFLIKKEGDYFRAKGEIDKAIKSYKKAINYDPESPDNHYALADLHRKEDSEGYISAGYEYEQSFEHRDKFSNLHTKLLFYEDYIKYQLYRYKLEGNYSKPDLLIKAFSAAKESRLLKPDHYQILLKTAETDYYMIKYLNSESMPQNKNKTDIRKKKDEYIEDAMQKLEMAGKIETGDYKFYNILMKIFYEKLNSLSSPGTEEARMLAEKIAANSRKYLLYKPVKVKIDDETKAIMQFQSR